MRILIETHHPSDIHFWKYVVRQLMAQGHTVKLLSRDRDVMKQLLTAYDWIPSEIITSMSGNNKIPLLEMLGRQFKVASAIRKFNPDVVVSLFGSYTQSAKLLGKRNLIFTDSEFQHFNHRIAHPFADLVYTPECFWKDLGKKHRRYRGYHELAFLHPKYFTPRPEVLEKLGVAEGGYLMLRLSAWNTLHDIGQSGLGDLAYKFVEEWKDRYRIFIVPEEGKCDPRLRDYIFKLPPDWFHDALYYARLVLTEGASTASEAACMGVPTVYVNSTEHRGYLDELETKFGLAHCYAEGAPGIEKARTLLNEEATLQRKRLEEAREKMLTHNEDVTEFAVKAITGQTA
ncbi:hypothetical protein DDZ13_01450 [Coraliomargarita sinensis]|uniref:DUF354 domain-containing protein n=1 Tax=Coraliomargarita sinensis TaxID=2174842 RepID=A0A317ZJ01_9BACT|nr:DUF354 domain-containing protein [Coraliomargarita sinensis]PXA05566.1 hypothetical protein DDZ13_01450 [Coraliomargarita sinensis]